MYLTLINRLKQAIRDIFANQWLIVFIILAYLSREKQTVRAIEPPGQMIASVVPTFVSEDAPPATYWGPVDEIGFNLHPDAGRRKARKFSNIAFVINPSLKNRQDVTKKDIEVNMENCKDYVRRFSSVARAEMRKYNIPASITLAQGLLESDAGGSRLSHKNNNHFGIKCFSRKCSKGHCSNFTDDTHKDFFRIYKSSWESYRAHSQLLNGKRYSSLKQYGKDYKKWAHGLRQAGYATDKKYAEKLIAIIETLHLDEFDR